MPGVGLHGHPREPMWGAGPCAAVRTSDEVTRALWYRTFHYQNVICSLSTMTLTPSYADCASTCRHYQSG